MNKSLRKAAVASILALAVQGAYAQGSGLSITTGIDYTEGDYGTGSSDNWTWVVPVVIKYETGPVTLKVNVPYVRTRGVNRDVGAAVGGSSSDTQSGLGDTTVSGFYTVLTESGAGVGLDLGLKVKLVTADKDKDLITTGNEDYSLQADLYKTFGPVTAFGTVGWTKKGDIRFRDRSSTSPTFNQFLTSDPRDPWYASVGGSYKLTQDTSVGLAYDWRQKLFDNSKEISEATLFVTHKMGKNWKLQGYGLTGFSNASPDWGLGATIGYGF